MQRDGDVGALGLSGRAANLPGDHQVAQFCAPTDPEPTNCGTLTLDGDRMRSAVAR